MVDAIVSFVVQRLGDYLIQEAVFLKGVRDEVESLKKELQWMQCFLKDAVEKQADDRMIRQWVSDIRDIAYDSEDVLDRFMLQICDGAKVGEDETLKKKQGFFVSIKKCSCIFGSPKESRVCRKGKEKVNIYSIGKEIEVLRQRLKDLFSLQQSYGIQIKDKREGEIHALGRLKQLRRATSFAVEENVVGFEDDANILLGKLFDKQRRRFVVSIFGMGGLGKTTLARKLYHNNDVKNTFDACAWVSVSQDYNYKDLLLRIIRSFNIITQTEDLDKNSEEDLERCLNNSLQGFTYLLVIDDIWHREDWGSLKRAFPDNKNGSRVIITTRIKEVAELSDARTHFHALRFLREDESWKLFCEKAFRNSDIADEGLESLGRQMVQKCGGLPLAISVLGGLLSTKKPHEWRVVCDHIWRHLRAGSIQISFLLDLSFNDLSHQLKLCFLYLGLFPEDFEISMEKLIRLLVAEDFIEQNEDQTMEEVAEDILDELINRSLIQIERRCWGRVVTLRVHDLMRDLTLQKAKDLNFIHICDEFRNRNPTSVVSSCRRQAVYSETSSCLWQKCGNPLSRSLLLFDYKWKNTNRIGEQFSRFPLLRVLDVEASAYVLTGLHRGRCLSEEIGKLIHMKYLGLRNGFIEDFPSSIVNLQRLQTLDLSDTVFLPTNLPAEIGRLQELRHLIGNFEGPLPIENLINLQTLKYVEVESWNKLKSDKLVNLRELHIEAKGRSKIQVFTFDSIALYKNLKILSVRLKDNDSFASLHPLSDCPCLIDLRLSGRIKKLPMDMDAILPNLRSLSLTFAHIEKDPLPILGKLPNLMILDLHFNSDAVNKLTCKAQGFPGLEILQLDVDELEEWQVEEGAMPRLRGLRISENFELMIPERLRSIPPPAELVCEDDRYGL